MAAKARRILRIAAALTAGLGAASSSAIAQRPQFPTPVSSAPAAVPATPAPAARAWDPYSSSGISAYPSAASPTYSSSAYPTQPPPATYSPPGYPASAYPSVVGAPPASGTYPPPAYTPPPATSGSSIFGTAPNYSTAPPAVYAPPPPGYPAAATPYPASPYPGYAPAYAAPAPQQREGRFESLSLLTNYIPDLHGDGMGVTEVDINAAFKMRFPSESAPLYISPGFAFHFWDGPDNYPLPARTYDAYVNFAWRPLISQNFGLDLGFTPSLSTDFENTSSDMWRFQAKALGIVALTPRSQFVLGVYYLDRLQIKLLPAGGLIWTPNDDSRFEIFFPRPKVAFRLPSLGADELWLYFAGEYGGGRWAIKRDDGVNDRFDYNDIRVYVGLQWERQWGGQGFFEFGYVFNRELDFYLYQPDFNPGDSLMLRGGVSF